jgi:[CysO sulfur-carrier protein]-S-L-cysteine hydrolase
MRIPQAIFDEMVAHAQAEAPNECCGIVTGSDGVATRLFRAHNIFESPLRYEIDPKDLIRIYGESQERDEEFAVIYHSHTGSAAYPSQTDVNTAAYPDSVYVIVSLEDPDAPDVKGFWIRDGKIEEAELQVG